MPSLSPAPARAQGDGDAPPSSFLSRRSSSRSSGGLGRPVRGEAGLLRVSPARRRGALRGSPGRAQWPGLAPPEARFLLQFLLAAGADLEVPVAPGWRSGQGWSVPPERPDWQSPGPRVAWLIARVGSAFLSQSSPFSWLCLRRGHSLPGDSTRSWGRPATPGTDPAGVSGPMSTLCATGCRGCVGLRQCR